MVIDNKVQFCMFIFILGISACQNKPPKQNSLLFENTFCWVSDSLDGRFFDKVAIYVPIKINDINNLPFQFDLGANQTLIYENPLKKYPTLHSKIQIIDATAAGNKVFELDSIDLYFGNKQYENYKSYGLIDYGHDINNTLSPCKNEHHFGSIGGDLFQKSAVIIDFIKQTITVTDSLTEQQDSQFHFIDCEIINNYLVIPIEVSGKTYRYIYDTGASLFSILTSESIANELTNKNDKETTLLITNFGTPVETKGKISKGNFKIGQFEFKSDTIRYSSFFRFEEREYDGLIGNAMFLDRRVCLDFKNKKFGINIIK